MRQNESITRIMSDDLITTNPTDKFSKIKNLMMEHQIHHIPVVNGKKLVGIVSRLDIYKYSHSQAFVTEQDQVDESLDQNVSAQDIMTKQPVTLKSSDTIKHAVEVLNNSSFNSIPVIKPETSQLVGMVTTKDLLNFLMKQY